ncbi:MAG: YihY/virulence factor BrkB family protein [Clostridia bacterium]|nr:YihY/virulence factor BrkB family protein [Clostridia bacterium]
MKKTAERLRRVLQRISQDGISMYSAQVAYYLLFAAVPFLMLVFAVSKYIIPFSEAEVTDAITKYIPESIFPAVTIIAKEFFGKTLTPVLLITAVTTFWTNSRAISAIAHGLNTIYRIQGRRGIIKEALFAFTCSAVLFAAIILVLVFMVFGSVFQSRLFSDTSFIGGALSPLFSLRPIILLCLLTLFFDMIYTFLPAKRGKLGEHFPGAVFTASGWIIFSWLFSLYVENFSTHSYIYGSLTALILLMLWIYSCLNIMFFGAEINCYIIKKTEET